MEVKPITVQDYKDYAKRHGIRILVSDDELKEALDAGNRLEEEHIKDREQRKEAHRERMSKLLEKASYPEPPKDLDEFFARGREVFG